MRTGEDVNNVPAKAVCFKRVHIEDFIIFNTSTPYFLSSSWKLPPIHCSVELYVSYIYSSEHEIRQENVAVICMVVCKYVYILV